MYAEVGELGADAVIGLSVHLATVSDKARAILMSGTAVRSRPLLENWKVEPRSTRSVPPAAPASRLFLRLKPEADVAIDRCRIDELRNSALTLSLPRRPRGSMVSRPCDERPAREALSPPDGCK
jgi:hypothetical protein